jgi:hypothetical protein
LARINSTKGIHTYRQTDKKKDRLHTNILSARQTGRQVGRQTVREKHRQTGQTDRKIDIERAGWVLTKFITKFLLLSAA